MGFYRTGKLWAIEHFGVKPDIIVFGKALTNGLNPLAGVWAREELINPHGLPARLHPLDLQRQSRWARAVALEAMKMMGETDYETHGDGEGRLSAARACRSCKRRHKIVGDVDGLGLALRMEICEPHDSFTPSQGDRRPHGGRGARRATSRSAAGQLRPRARHRRLLQERRHAGAEPAYHPARDGLSLQLRTSVLASREQAERSQPRMLVSNVEALRRRSCPAARWTPCQAGFASATIQRRGGSQGTLVATELELER